MKRNRLLADRIREVLINGNWIANTNYKDQLQGVSWQQAKEKIGDLNTIVALTYHINYYLSGLLDAFDTGKLEIRDKFSFDAPTIDSENDWNNLVENFLSNSEKFANLVEKLDDEVFDQPFINPSYGTFLRNIEGVIEHSYYHLGQISLIRKMVTKNGNNLIQEYDKE